MTYASVQMFMQKLNQLICCNNIPLLNNPEIISERPQFQLLYNDLGSMIQTLFIDQHHDLEQVTDLKQRFIHAAEKAEYNVDLFLSDVHIRNHGDFQMYEDFKRSRYRDDVKISFKSVVDMFLSFFYFRSKLSLKLDDVRRSFNSIKVGYTKKVNSSRKKESKNQSAAAQSSILVSSKGSKNLSDEMFVGIDGDAELIRDKLVEDQRKLDVVSIVGMGGIGKTTLATKVFNDAYVKHHFYVRVWVTVSQMYDKRDVLTQILASMGVKLDRKKDADSSVHEEVQKDLDLEHATDSRLRELVHKNLMGKRYLIVIDDIWHVETWDNLKLFFPHDNNGSRILLTSRLTEVAKHANSDGLIHHLGYLNKEKGWELLCRKVFYGSECPEWAIEPGMQIVENCKGLPLALVLIAGVLAKETWSQEFWVELAEKTGSYIVGNQNGWLETLALSYNHLPLLLRECFLYLGGFPEDYLFKVRSLISLWVAEGFIVKDGSRSLDVIAEGYLMDLIDRNLVIVAERSKYNGRVKACKVHDLVRELCIRKAKEERIILITERLILSARIIEVVTQPYKLVRMFINKDIYNLEVALPSAHNLRSILCFSYFRPLIDVIANGFHSFELLRVLDLCNYRLNYIHEGLESLVHLSNISNLVNLRHLWSYHSSKRERNKREKNERAFYIISIEKPMNLQTISNVELKKGANHFEKCFPYIKKLRCRTYLDEQNDFKSLTYLEKLKFTSLCGRVDHITFPSTLKSLALGQCYLPWSEMTIIQSLPNLQVLKLHQQAFEGGWWNTDGQEFPQLKFLRLEWLDIKVWESYSTSFPCLRQLEIISCKVLEEIPLEIGEIPTLELIYIQNCRDSVGESVRRIEEEQHDLGNFDLKINIMEKQDLLDP